MTSGIRNDALDPAPFREWCDEWIESNEGGAKQLAHELRVDERRLHAWRFQNLSLERHRIEDALHQVDLLLWDVYPGLEDAPAPDSSVPDRGGVPKGYGAKLSDDQIRALAEELWEQFGFASAESASWSIRQGFRRVGLKTIHHRAKARGARRCAASNQSGDRCGAMARRGQDLCWAHHPDTHSLARENGLRNSPWAVAA